MSKAKLRFPNRLTSNLERKLIAQLDEETFQEVARKLLRYETFPGDDLVIGQEKIAEFTGYSKYQIARWSPALQELNVLRKTTKHDVNQRRPVVFGYKSHLREFFRYFSPSMKRTLNEMRRKAKHHDCPKCGYRIHV